MSKFQRWIDAVDLMKRWDITPIDLTDLIVEGGLTMYDPFYKNPLTPEYVRDFIIGLNKSGMNLGFKLPFADQRNKYVFKLEEVILLEDKHNINTEPAEFKEKNLRQSQMHNARCRAIAEVLWGQNPKMTIEDMINSDEINKIGCENESYNEKTIRNWIKDLCPNRSPGRRPTPK
jgi:hypothetical protein